MDTHHYWLSAPHVSPRLPMACAGNVEPSNVGRLPCPWSAPLAPLRAQVRLRVSLAGRHDGMGCLRGHARDHGAGRYGALTKPFLTAPAASLPARTSLVPLLSSLLSSLIKAPSCSTDCVPPSFASAISRTTSSSRMWATSSSCRRTGHTFSSTCNPAPQ
jgi:hypothetical protein